MKFKRLTLQEWQDLRELESKDPNTRYTVFNPDGTVYGEFLGPETTGVDNLRAKVGDIGDLAEDLKTRTENLELKATTNEDDIDSLETRATNVENRVTMNEQDIDDLEVSMGNAEQELVRLEQDKADITYVDNEIAQAIDSVYNFKGSVLFENLPTTNQKVGDTYNILNDFTLGGVDYLAGTDVSWNGTAWNPLGSKVPNSSQIKRSSNPLESVEQALVSLEQDTANLDTKKINKTDIVNDLTTGGATKVLSANQGKVLNDTKENLSNKATNFGTVNDTRYPSVKAVKDQLDLTAKLAVSNVFTQPQQVPNATQPQHAVNKLQVETMFEMFKQQLRGYNLASPDLTGKEYLGNGEYRVYLRPNGFSIYYNVYTGVYTLNGESQNGYSVNLTNETFDSNYYYSSTIQRLNENYSNYTSNYIQLSGNQASGYLYLNNDVIKNTKVENQIGIDDRKIIRITFNHSSVYNNFQFKLQIEKGTTATPFAVPGQIPQYKIVGEE